jgi:hypothetical protein
VRPGRRAAIAGALLAGSIASWGCGDSPERRVDPAHADSVVVVFTRDEAPVPVVRAVTGPSTGPRDALEWLLRGPTPEERDAGIHSWFSAETAGALRSIEIDSTGRATVDFRDLRRLIPSASSSAGSAALLLELNGTLFRFPEIRSVEYRIDGSCETFWNWLQYECRIVPRPGG